MSKYIIDIPKTVGMGKVGSVHYTYFDGIQCQTIVLKSDEIEELNSDYINEHYGSLQDDAYNKGYAQCQDDYSDALKHAKDTAYKKGLHDGESKCGYCNEYQRGLDDAWEAARKIGHCKLWGDYTKDTGKPSVCAVAVLDHYTAYEAIEKLKAYEEKQKTDNEIKVGDEVETKDGKRFIVTTFGSGFDGDIAVGVCADGFGLGVDLKELCKTGRHFDISSILKEMQS